MKKLIISWCFLLLSMATSWAQSFTSDEKLQGYAMRGETLWFILDPVVYNITGITKATVTGEFRAWNSNMEDLNWALYENADGLWVLSVNNKKYEKIRTKSMFKFIYNDTKWLDVPVNAKNILNGNLQYGADLVPPYLKAEILSNGQVWAKILGINRSLNPKDYKLTNAKGEEIVIKEIMPNTASETLIVPASPLNPKRVYFLEIPKDEMKAFCSYDGWFKEMYSNKELGANISPDGKSTAFRIFAPRADSMKLYLYNKPLDQKAFKVVNMSIDNNGVWEVILEGNLKGIYYDFTVHGVDEVGNHFFGTEKGYHTYEGMVKGHINDPYSRVNVGTYGKSRVWEKSKPATPLKNGIPKMEDVIAYEVHIQDFTDLLPVADDLKGTIPAFTTTGLKNSSGQAIGFDYLTNLGINVVHLMPVQEFMHYPDSMWAASFKNDEYMKRQWVNMESYEWGYRTSHAFAVESKYRRKGTEHGAEREQFKNLVQSFHDKGIAVIIDIVPNHTAENMDYVHWNFHWNALDKIYYYRTNNQLEHIGEYGNEVKTENRPMVQRWLIDQCKMFIEEFGIDGFRIDLAGQVDEQTLIKLRQALGEDKIIYGEPWIGSNDPDFEGNPDWDWYKSDSPITFFQDDARNAFKGTTANPKDKNTDRGYAGGKLDDREKVMKGIANTFPEDKNPNSGINYLDIHDNWALADQFGTINWDGRNGVDEDRFKIAAVLLYTSLGPIVTHGGTEMMRSKSSAPLEEIMKRTTTGIQVPIHGKRDTYNIRECNHFIWENVGKSFSKKNKDVSCDYAGMYAFWQGLNKFRLSDYGKSLRVGSAVPENYVQFITPENLGQLGYIIDNKILVLMNVDTKQGSFTFKLPDGKWKLIAKNEAVDLNGLKDSKSKLEGGENNLSLDGTSFKIWVKE
jgi:pullulanase/glycogen debranching enzyme